MPNLILNVKDDTEKKPDIMCLDDEIMKDIQSDGLVQIKVQYLVAMDDDDFDEHKLSKEKVEISNLKFTQDPDYEENFTFTCDIKISFIDDIWNNLPDKFKKHASSSGPFEIEFGLEKNGKKYKLNKEWAGNKLITSSNLD